MQHDLPLVLNADANWNNEFPETKEEYLDYYMAKNLYILQCVSLNQAEPEGESSHLPGRHMALVPQGISYPNTDYTVTDEQWFWQAPER